MYIKLIRTKRKTMAIQVTPDLRVVVRAPLKMPRHEIESFVLQKEDWIKKTLHDLSVRRAVENTLRPAPKNAAEMAALKERARTLITARALFFARKAGVTYGRISIRNQKTRWGSCSAAGNLNFNLHLAEMPPEILDYVVVHELCHRKEMNHSARFWREVEAILPDYRERRKWLHDNGFRYQG
jgi:predicted metal-dependent hydrolase